MHLGQFITETGINSLGFFCVSKVSIFVYRYCRVESFYGKNPFKKMFHHTENTVSFREYLEYILRFCVQIRKSKTHLLISGSFFDSVKFSNLIGCFYFFVFFSKISYHLSSKFAFFEHRWFGMGLGFFDMLK